MNLNQVTIWSNKPTESIEFYQKLGLRLIVDSAPRYVRFECPNGDSTFSIHFIETISDASNITLYFECENLEQEVKRLKKLGLVFESEITDQTWLWREAYLRDPNGNSICLFYAGENRKNPPWKIK
ncbi:MAG: VOC family protein [Pyrinomonadaceae bacterium]|jgi:catechol 2,3-dioxygenase-like lactoylglutathione lyase family enzyme|nr:VOC family protein [Pyrinomonadaceae bacterium]